MYPDIYTQRNVKTAENMWDYFCYVSHIVQAIQKI